MARSIWKGRISFGLVKIPVGLYTAEARDEVSFHLLDTKNLAPIRYKRVSEKTGREDGKATAAKGRRDAGGPSGERADGLDPAAVPGARKGKLPAGGRRPAAKAARTKSTKAAKVAEVQEPARPKSTGNGKGETEVAGVRLSNPDRVLYPGQGLTKRDLALYYERVAGWILPHLADRPLTLVRCPAGHARQCFYQKHVTEQFPRAVLRVDVGEKEPYGAVHSVQGIVSLVQMGVLELHIWGARRDRIEQPDYVVFDLDPDEGLPWERVVLGALTVRQRLASLGLTTFLKTTGGKGLHVVVPLTRKAGWDEVKAFAKAVAEDVAAAEPALYTSKLPKVRRQGKVFLDYLRNGRGATSICAYSTRSRPGAPVSAPLHWEELEDLSLSGSTFTVQNLQERLDSLKSDPWQGIGKVRQSITARMKKELGMD